MRRRAAFLAGVGLAAAVAASAAAATSIPGHRFSQPAATRAGPAAATSDPASPGPRAPTRADRRVPVLLLPGWFNEREAMVPLRDRLVDAGWDSAAVLALGFDDPVGSNREHAREIARAVLGLREATGAARVDVVAHSMGGLALRYYLWNGGAHHVRRAVFLATPHRGTMTSFLAWGDGAEEMRPGSPFLVSITRAPVLPPEVRALTVRTPLDLHVVPAESATLPGVPDAEVCCPTHEGMLDDDETFETVRRFLDGR